MGLNIHANETHKIHLGAGKGSKAANGEERHFTRAGWGRQRPVGRGQVRLDSPHFSAATLEEISRLKRVCMHRSLIWLCAVAHRASAASSSS